MSTFNNASNYSIWDQLFALKTSVEKSKKKALKKRLSTKPQATKLEYLLGAFIEMYEPHLHECILEFVKKGYVVDISSGFGGKNSDLQVIKGDFSINYITHNKLEKIGVKVRDDNGSKSLVFWPKVASLEHIKNMWRQVINILPDKGALTEPLTNYQTIAFRRKYIPEDLSSQKQRLFDKLKYKIQEKVKANTIKRIKTNPHPNKTEILLGLFLEELEPQVRQAVLAMNKKGYSVDGAGFTSNPCEQMVEGDFQLEKKTITKLQTIGVTVETNHSGYTRIQFTSPAADIIKIKNKWHKIISFLPKKNRQASSSMTKRARDFRIKYA